MANIISGNTIESHETDAVEQQIKQVGFQLLFLPTYSPNLSPLEEDFSKLKAFRRRCRYRTIPALIWAIA